MTARLILCLSILATTAACAGRQAPALEAAGGGAVEWRVIATSSDRARLRSWRSAWVEALAKARAAGHGREIAAEGALLDPDAGVSGLAPAPGDYACRVIKLGAKGPGLLDYVAYPAFSCRVGAEGDRLSFEKRSGSQRPIGFILPGNDRRAIFLGTLQLGDERLALEYGRDQERDMAGIVERVAPFRYRVVFPWPRLESKLDVIELIPVTD